MSDAMRFEFALQEPAMAIAPVFVAFPKQTTRRKLDVTFHFGEMELQWRGPDALGATEQSVLLGLLSIARQQQYWLSSSAESDIGKLLLSGLDLVKGAPETDFSVAKISWSKLVVASGYQFGGGTYVSLVKAAVKRLAETTVWERRDGNEYQSRLLSWCKGDKDGVTVALNRRATDALCGGQFTRISLSERHSLDEAYTKILHAWLSGCIHVGSSKKFSLTRLQSHVWAGEVTGSALRNRRAKLRDSLAQIGGLRSWTCQLLSQELVEVTRARSQAVSVTDPGSIGDGRVVSVTAES